jgi:hypothetical protein
MHVIREKMTLLDPALFLLRQPAERLPKVGALARKSLFCGTWE